MECEDSRSSAYQNAGKYHLVKLHYEEACRQIEEQQQTIDRLEAEQMLLKKEVDETQMQTEDHVCQIVYKSKEIFESRELIQEMKETMAELRDKEARNRDEILGLMNKMQESEKKNRDK